MDRSTTSSSHLSRSITFEVLDHNQVGALNHRRLIVLTEKNSLFLSFLKQNFKYSDGKLAKPKKSGTNDLFHSLMRGYSNNDRERGPLKGHLLSSRDGLLHGCTQGKALSCKCSLPILTRKTAKVTANTITPR